MADPDAIYELAQRIESNIEVDKRVAALHALQSQLESAGYVVEADAVTSAVKVALKHANQSLSTASLSFIPTYASMIYSGDGSESHSILNHNVRMLVNSVSLLVIEKLGDQKERIREAARTALIELGNAAYAISSGHLMTSGKGKETETPLGIFERILREAGLGAKFARVREQSVLLLPILRQNCEKYPVRPLLPITVDLLSDADATVREGARSTLISLFSNATPAAKADLKKELEKKAVRKQTADGILREVLAAPSAAIATPTAPSPVPSSGFAPSRTHSITSYDAETPTSHTKSAPSATASATATAAADDIRPVYIASRSDLERTFAIMMPFFESKESEHNWLNREQSMIKIRGLIVSGAHRQFGEAFFVSLLKTAQEGILKCVASLRTTLSMHAVHLVQELAIELGDDLAPCVEAFLIHLIGMAGFTKKLIANATQEAAAAIMVNVSFRLLYLQLIWQGIQDKNVATRTAAADHLCTVLNHHAAHRKHAMESHGGLDLLDKSLRKGVGDSNPAARTKAREAFWIFHRYWPDQANTILNSLDPSTKKQVAAMAPADVETKAIVEKPRSSAPARVRPGGASMALIQAKKAAAIKAAQERQESERRKAEEAAAAHEARVAAARQALAEQQAQAQAHAHAQADEYATPVANHRVKSTGFMPTRNRNLKPSSELSVLVSPTAHQRIETAVAVPLPISPTPVGSTPQSRTNSTSETASQPRSPALSPVAARTRAVSSSSFSSQGSGSTSSARMQASTPRNHHTAHKNHSSALDADLHDLSIADVADEGDNTADATAQPRYGAGEQDDTLQLAAPEDASMDLMGSSFSSPFKLPAATDRAAKTQSVLLESTPRAPRTVSASSTTTPSSASRRSGLPRPVSMMHSVSPIAAHLPKSTSTRVLAVPSASASGKSSTLENRAQRLESAVLSPSPAKERPEVWAWIQALQGGTADVKMFRRLARLSAEFKVSRTENDGGREEGEGEDEGENGDETVLTPGPLADALNRKHAAREQEGEGGEGAKNGMFKSGTAAWSDGGLFTALIEGLTKYLIPSDAVNAELALSAQVVLHRLLENQFALFRSTNVDHETVELLLTSIGSLNTKPPATATATSSSTIVARKAAVQGYESLLTTWATQCDPILGFDTLLTSSSSPASSSVALFRSALTPLLLRLPSELLLEDHLPRLKDRVTDALSADSTELRLAATTMLKKLNDKLQREGVDVSHTRIFAALGLEGEKDRALLDVLMYYFSKK